MPDQQDHERHSEYAARCHRLEARCAQLEASNNRLTTLVGKVVDENVILKYELGGDVTERVRTAAYALVQSDMEEHDVVGVNNVGDGTWWALRGHDAEYADVAGSLIGAIDAAKGAG